MPYHSDHSLASFILKSAERSITLTPRTTKLSAINIAVPLGVAKNTTSQVARDSSSGKLNSTSILPRKLGYTASTRVPASALEVTTPTSTSVCNAKILSNSTPVYPVPPTTPARIIFYPTDILFIKILATYNNRIRLFSILSICQKNTP